MGRTAAKVDGNQGAIVAALRDAGASVQSLATIGDGCPDLLCAINGHTFVIECKMPGEPLRPRQKEWHDAWAGRVHVAFDIKDALFIANCYKKIPALVL